MRNDRDRDNFERKLLKFWIQSFLLGVPRIIVGFRSRDGVLQRVEDMDVASIPDTVARRGRQWDGNVCTNFAASFLECESYSHLFWKGVLGCCRLPESLGQRTKWTRELIRGVADRRASDEDRRRGRMEDSSAREGHSHRGV